MNLCKCGKEHKTGTKHTIIGENALRQLRDVVMAGGCKNILLVADQNTYSLAGKKISSLLHPFHVQAFVYAEGSLTPDEKSLGQLVISTYAEDTGKPIDIIVALGAGTINDLCRYVSFRLGIPYIIIATAPSMDGYASNVSPLIVSGLKTTYTAAMAYAIIGDTDLLSTAPTGMVGAGLGDIVGRYNCPNDWELSRIVNGEYYCEDVAALTRSSIETCIAHADGLMAKTASSITALMESLTLSGVAMSYVGNSRPASGSEHHLSHFWEMMFLFDGRPPVLHGIKVGVATLVMIKLHELLSAMPVDWCALQASVGSPDPVGYIRTMERVFKQAAADIISSSVKINRSSRENILNRLQTYQQNWPLILETIRKNIPPYEKVQSLLEKVGNPVSPKEIGVKRDEFIDGICFAKEIRQRYTVLQMVADMGMLPKYAETLANFFYE